MSLFRKKALEHLTSPEELDQVMQVTSPIGWIALLTCALLVSIGTTWAYYGSIPTKVCGRGILVEKGALFSVTTLGEGQVVELLVDVDDRVEQGQIIALVSQPDIKHKLDKAKRTLDVLNRERNIINKMGIELHASREKHIAQQRNTIQDSIKLATVRLNDLHERVGQYKKLLAQGIVARKAYLDVKAEYNLVLRDIYKYREQLTRLPITGLEAVSKRKIDQITIERRIIHAEEDLETLKEHYTLASQVTTAKAGRINELFKGPGSFVAMGEPILNIEIHSPENEFYISAYFAPEQGKRIQKGMTMHVAPSVAKREEFGSIIAKVISVSTFPASSRGMMNRLKNQNLVTTLSQNGSPIKVRAKLLKDPSSLTGFKWTSGKGAPVLIQTGTMCQAEVVVEERPPTTLIIPYIKRAFLGIGEEN